MDKELELEMINSAIFAEKLLNGKLFFGKYCALYPFTTENIKGLLQVYNTYNKDILIPCASSDHIFNFLLQNPKSITAFDINSLTKHLFHLKKACLLALDRDEYLDYFYIARNNKKALSFELYKKAREYLPKKEIIFWDSLYRGFTDKQLRSSYLFYYPSYNKKTIKAINPYLDDSNFEPLKNKLNQIDIDFVNDDVFNISIDTDKKYDFIYLSNIAFYRFSLNSLNKLVSNFADNLYENGNLGLVYLYNYDDPFFDDSKRELYNPKKRAEYFSNDCFEYLEFRDVLNESLPNRKVLSRGDHDAVLNYKK